MHTIDVVVYGPPPLCERLVLGDVVVAGDAWLENVPEDFMMDINLSILTNSLELVLHRKPKVGGETP